MLQLESTWLDRPEGRNEGKQASRASSLVAMYLTWLMSQNSPRNYIFQYVPGHNLAVDSLLHCTGIFWLTFYAINCAESSVANARNITYYDGASIFISFIWPDGMVKLMNPKCQIISKRLLVSSDSSKKRTNEIVFSPNSTKKSLRNYLTFKLPSRTKTNPNFDFCFKTIYR